MGEGGPEAADDLLERAPELSVLESALEAARAGGGRVVMIEGEAGIGKSRLLAAVDERARAAGMRVLSASGLELERTFPFGLALRLLEPALAGLEPVRREQLFAGQAASAAPLLTGRHNGDPVRGVDHGSALVHGLRWLIVNLVATVEDRTVPLLISVDDAHWSDESSLRFLAHLSAGLPALPVTVVVAVRRDAHDLPATPIDALAAVPEARLLRPGPLSDEAVIGVVRTVYPDAAPAFARACAHTSGGNPFYLHELLESARADGMGADAEGAAEVEALVPESVVRSVLLRVARLPEAATGLASATAVLGDGSSLRHAAALADLDEPTAERAADALAAAHILRAGEPLAFAHPLIGAAVAADLPALARSRAHKRAAGLLSADGAPPETVGAHLLACRAEGDAKAVEILRTAATRAAARGEHGAAARFLVRALDEPPAAEERPGLSVELALVQAAAGTPDATERVRQSLELVEVPETRVEVLRALARLLFASGELPGAAEALERAYGGLEPDDPLGRELLVDQMTVASADPRLRGRAGARFAAILERARAGEPPPEPALLAQLSGWMVALGRPAAEVRAVAGEALARLPDDDGFYGAIRGFAVLALLWVDELELVAQPIEAAWERAREGGSLIGAGMTSHWLAILCYQRGDLTESIAAALESLDACSAGWDICSGWVGPLLAHAEIDRGDLEAAREALLAAERIGDERMERPFVLEARGRLALVRGEAQAALEDFQAAGALAERHQITQPTMLAWRSWASLAAGGLGDRRAATELAEEEVERARELGAPRTLGVALRAAGLAAGGERGLELLGEAAAVLDRSPAALERARALIELGAALRRAGRRASSREPLGRGLALAERLGAAPLASRAHDELRAAGGRRRPPRVDSGPESLTPTERRVAELGAQGLATAEIARALYVTPKTVDWHLGHVYQKLGIHSRRELGAALAGAPGATNAPSAAPGHANQRRTAAVPVAES